jgi:hypothetical protein
VSAGIAGRQRVLVDAPDDNWAWLSVLDSAQADRLWPDLSLAVKEAFEGADFCDGFGPESPLVHSFEGITGPDRGVYRHVVAGDPSGAILGACFRVPVRLPDAENRDADPGWFFTAASLDLAARMRVADALIRRTHELMSSAGFTRVVTNMGTRAGAVFLQRKWGYTHSPSESMANRWVREL